MKSEVEREMVTIEGNNLHNVLAIANTNLMSVMGEIHHRFHTISRILNRHEGEISELSMRAIEELQRVAEMAEEGQRLTRKVSN